MQLTVSRPAARRRPRRLAAAAALALTALAVGSAPAAQAGGHRPAPPAAAPTAEVVTTTERGGRTVALTFDDGPNGADTRDLLRVLRRNHVKATFCLWGDHVREDPDLVRRIAAEGHTLCNHTMHHDNMQDWDPERVRADLEATSALIRSVVPGARIPFFRAPYGAWGQTPQVAAELGMQPLGWAFTVEDWVPPGADVLAQRFRDQLTPGAVALMHDGGGDRSDTVEAVATLVPELRRAGWRFTLPAGAPRGGRW
ncbi:polysaccharide deacetylase family protein [Kineococcus sp. SYSU DK005]|uniref:polysaccharide deacetylase family protein n=1 Tax=Kineococcus sp. SYSU DK005 TaxID=3383126 RepID=UPI003D7E0C21